MIETLLSQWTRHAPWAVPLAIGGAWAIWWTQRRATVPSECPKCPWVLWALLVPFIPDFANSLLVWLSKPQTPPVLASLLAPPLAFFVLDTAILLTVGPFWRPLRVFVSFYHSRESEVIELVTALRAAALDVTHVPYVLQAEHDQVLSNVQTSLRWCDALVCLPGDRPSFVESEVLAASALRKAIVFVVDARSPRLPNTALYGYPVFRLEKLRSRSYGPLASLLKLACGEWRESGRFVGRVYDIWRVFPSCKVALILIVAWWLIACVSGALVVVTDADVQAAISFAIRYPVTLWDTFGTAMLSFGVFGAAGFVGATLLLLGLHHTRAILKQRRPTGHNSFRVLRSSLGRTPAGRRILVCLLRRAPLAEHHAAKAIP